MRIHRTRFGTRAGLTLVEVSISALLFGGVIAGAGLISTQGQGAYLSISRANDLSARCSRAIEQVTNELAGLDLLQMFPDPGTDGGNSLSFQMISGFAGGAVTYAPTASIGFEYDDGEVDDGVDNDGDGLIDEGQVVITRNLGTANAVRAVICGDVSEFLQGEILNANDDNGNFMDDESGFCLQRNGSVIVVRLTLESVDEGGTLVQRTIETAIRMRNTP